MNYEEELIMLMKIVIKHLFRKYLKKELPINIKNIFLLKKKTKNIWGKDSSLNFSLFIFEDIFLPYRDSWLSIQGMNIHKDKIKIKNIAIKALNKIIKEVK